MNAEPIAKCAPRYWPYWIALWVMRGISLLPLQVLWFAGGLLGSIGYLVGGRQKRVTLINLALCFPELDPRAHRRLARRHFRAYGQALLSAGIPWWGSPRRLQRLTRFRDRHHYDEALAANRRIILLAPHFLGLEAGGLRLSQERPVVSMYKKPKKALFAYALNQRSRYAATMVERDAPLTALIRKIRQGLPFYYLPDQDPGHGQAVFAPFFGIPAATVTALGRMAKMTDAVVIPCFTRLLPYGRGYEIFFYPPLADFPSDDPQADAQRMNAEIEKGVREMPEQYMWTYKRFKTRPDGAASFYD
jgi:KDO2-lipid IV(A) lauroyltransferase